METPAVDEVKQEEAVPVDANGQGQLIPDEIKDEEDVREVLIPMQPHELIDAFERIFDLHAEVKEWMEKEETEKARHKEEKERISSALATAELKRSQLLDQAKTKRKKEMRNTIKRINYTTRTVTWHLRETGEQVDERAMVPAEYQVKLALPDNVTPIEEAREEKEEEKDENPGDAQGVDPSTFDSDGNDAELGEGPIEEEDDNA